jgi:hypothetical protein
MKRNFNELFSRMTPEAQERVKARTSKLLQEIVLADPLAGREGATAAEGAPTCSTGANAASSDETNADREGANRKVALRSK